MACSLQRRQRYHSSGGSPNMSPPASPKHRPSSRGGNGMSRAKSQTNCTEQAANEDLGGRSPGGRSPLPFERSFTQGRRGLNPSRTANSFSEGVSRRTSSPAPLASSQSSPTPKLSLLPGRQQSASRRNSESSLPDIQGLKERSDSIDRSRDSLDRSPVTSASVFMSRMGKTWGSYQEIDDMISTSASTPSSPLAQGPQPLKFLQRRRRPHMDVDDQEDATPKSFSPRSSDKDVALKAGRGVLSSLLIGEDAEADRFHMAPQRSPKGAEHASQDAGGPTSVVFSSALLARRRARNPGVAALELQRDRLRHGSKKSAPLADIIMLPEGEKIYDRYCWDEVLQEQGCGGKVVICRPKGAEKSDGLEVGDNYVMKMKSKASLLEHSEEAERSFRKAHLKMLNLPPHAGVLPLKEVLEDDSFYYVVMEKAKGGCLFTSLLQDYSDGNMPARALKNLMREVLDALHHVHKEGILHRDIKPDNLVVQVYDEPMSPGGKVKKVKIIDFDIADPDWCPASPGKRASWVGTLRHSAPETFRGIFSQRSDLYSVGTILYLLMAGKMPYDDTMFDEVGGLGNMEGIYSGLDTAVIDWSGSCWDKQPVCKEFCMGLLAFDPMGRPASAEEALTHRWFTEQD